MIYPEGTKVVVKPDEVEEVTKGGIYVPDTVRDQYQTAVTIGEIVAIGPLAEVYFSEDLEGDTKRKAKVGDRCMYAKFGGASVKRDRVEYRILQDQDIVCFVDYEENELPNSRKSMVKK